MSESALVDTGSFATSRGRPSREDADEVLRLLEHYPQSAVARMVGRSLDYVRLVDNASRLRAAAPTLPVPRAVRAPPAPRPAKPPLLAGPQPKLRHWRPSLPPRAKQAVMAVAAKHGVSFDALVTPSIKRGHPTLWPARQEAYYEVRAIKGPDGEPAFSLPLIGTWFGGRDHSTIMWGLRTHAARVAGEPLPTKYRSPRLPKAIQRQRREMRKLAARLAWREGEA